MKTFKTITIIGVLVLSLTSFTSIAQEPWVVPEKYENMDVSKLIVYQDVYGRKIFINPGPATSTFSINLEPFDQWFSKINEEF